MAAEAAVLNERIHAPLAETAAEFAERATLSAALLAWTVSRLQHQHLPVRNRRQAGKELKFNDFPVRIPVHEAWTNLGTPGASQASKVPLFV